MKRLCPALLALLTCAVGAQDISPTEGYLPQFSRTVPRAEREQIPLTVSLPEGAQLAAHPVTFGVPFPRGALGSAEQVRLLADGAETPAMIRRTATWDGPDGDVRWVLVDAEVRPGVAYALEYGAQVRRAPVEAALRVADDPDGVTVDTGALRFVVSRTAGDLIHAAWVDLDGDGEFTDAEAVVLPGASGAPYMIDDEGLRHELAPTDDYVVTVEQSGPLHAVIKVEGWYESEAGARLCQYLSRLHAYAGYSHVRVEHTFVVAFDTNETRLRDIGLPVALNPGAEAGASYGLQDGSALRVDGPSHLLQTSADRFVVRDAAGADLREGNRAPGWVTVTGAERGMTAGLRHVWQEHPKALSFDGETLTVHLWPPHLDRPLDFGARAVLGPERYAAWDQVYWQNFYVGGLDQWDQAFGLAKSNDLVLIFHGPEPGEAASVCRTLQEPVIVAASPEWMCRSDVMGPLRPRDMEQFGELEQTMEAGFDRFEFLREHLGNFGMIDYGDVNYQVTLDRENNRWERSPWRCWASRFYGHPVMPWVKFLRTGERRYLHWGIDNARHVMDVDMCHLDNPDLGKLRGGRYGGNGGIIHYGADIYDIGCDSHVDQLLLQYYLTGYRRAWDVLMEEAEHYLWRNEQRWGTLHRWGHRMTGGALRIMTALYQATWDERFLEIARRQAEFCYDNRDEEGVIRHDDVYMTPGMVTYYQATGDERMRELFLHCMRKLARAGRLESDPRSFSFYGPAMAYLITGDPTFLPWAERWKRDFLDIVNTGDDPFTRGLPRGEWDYCYLTLHLMYMPYYMEARSTLEAPVSPPVRDNAITSGEIVLWREDEREFHVTADWMCYDGSYSIGVSAPWLSRYVARNPVSPRLVLRSAAGEEVAAVPIPLGARGPAQHDIATATSSGKVTLQAPTGPPGTYRFAIEDTGTLHFKLRLASTDLHRWAYPTQDTYLACADAFHFWVGEQVETFEVAFKTLALRRPVKFAVYDAAGNLRAEEELEYGSNPQAQYVTWSFEAAPDQRGKLWRFTLNPSAPQVEQTFLRFTNVPPVVWTNPEAFFDPQAAAHERARPAPVEAPYEGAGAGRRVTPQDPLVIPRGEAVGEGRYESMDARQGTLEFWFRPEWAPDDISDHTILSCGAMRLYRRSSIGTYLTLGGVRQAALITLPGQWYHIAVTWDAGGPGRAPATGLFINGVECTGNMLGPATEPLGDWTGEAILIGGDVPFTVADLRISNIVRYAEDFDPPRPPEADEHTLRAHP